MKYRMASCGVAGCMAVSLRDGREVSRRQWCVRYIIAWTCYCMASRTLTSATATRSRRT